MRRGPLQPRPSSRIGRVAPCGGSCSSTSAVVFFDTLFFAALTPLLPHYAHVARAREDRRRRARGRVSRRARSSARSRAASSPDALGVKPTVDRRADARRRSARSLFGLADRGLAARPRALRAGPRERVLVDRRARLARRGARRPSDAGALIGNAFAAAVVGALFGPVLGGVASLAGIGWTFGAVGVASFGLVAWALATPRRRGRTSRRARRDARPRARRPRGCSSPPGSSSSPRSSSARCRRARAAAALARSASARSRSARSSSARAALEAVNNVRARARLRPARPAAADRRGPRRLDRRRGAPPVAGRRARSSRSLVVCARARVRHVLHARDDAALERRRGARPRTFGYSSALVNLAWAPGQTLGAAGGGALAHATSDAVPYLAPRGVCALTLARPMALARIDRLDDAIGAGVERLVVAPPPAPPEAARLAARLRPARRRALVRGRPAAARRQRASRCSSTARRRSPRLAGRTSRAARESVLLAGWHFEPSFRLSRGGPTLRELLADAARARRRARARVGGRAAAALQAVARRRARRRATQLVKRHDDPDGARRERAADALPPREARA